MLSTQKAILVRRYNVEATRRIPQNDNADFIKIEYVGLGKARQLRKEFHAEGYRVSIIEDMTIGRDGKEIIFHDPKPVVEPVKSPPANALLTPNREARIKKNPKNAKRNFDLIERIYRIETEGFTVYRNGVLVVSGLREDVAKRLFDEINNKGHKLEEFDIRKNGKVAD